MHIWLPARNSVDLMGGLPAGVTASIWDGSKEIPTDGADVEVLVTPLIPGDSAVLAEAVATTPRLRFVQSMFAGVDWIEPVLPKHVLLANTGAANAKPVAEWVVAMLLSHLRELPRFAENQRNGRWWRVLSDTLAYKRVTILGYGPIAQALEAMLATFGASTTVFARTAREHVRAIADLTPELGTTDILVVLTPLTDATRNLVNAEVLAALPDGAIVMNAARGPVVDNDALLRELMNGRLRAILDVTEPEPLPDGHPLWTAPNCTITPHVAGATTRYFDNVYPLVRSQLERLVAGLLPENLLQRS
jgi:phosphoglycerate dehydrogenase-like enzyme